MLRLVSIVLLIVGAILIAWGLGALRSVSSKVSQFFTGAPTETTVWYLGLGIAAVLVGLVGLYGTSRWGTGIP